MGLDRQTKGKLKKIAMEISELHMSDEMAAMKLYKSKCDSGELNCAQSCIVVMLTDLYVAIRRGRISKEDGGIRQKAIFEVCEEV